MATRKKTAPAEEIAEPAQLSEPAELGEAPPCVNCQEPAIWRETNPGANRDAFCDHCGKRAYPGNLGRLERIDG